VTRPPDPGRARLDRARQAREAELLETERDPGLASLVDLPTAAAVVLYGAPGTTAEDIDGFHDALVTLLALHDVERTGPRAARVRGENGVVLDVTWTAEDDPRSVARDTQRRIYAPPEAVAAPVAEPATEPAVAPVEDVDAQAVADAEQTRVLLRKQRRYNEIAEQEIQRLQAIAAARARTDYTTATETAYAYDTTNDEDYRVIDGPGIRGRYGILGGFNRG
jgi:hypothetical protein